ncbi:MAG TPA: hypothetical protein PKA58_30980, partial [Polyangium sp.]|nr:hypothetical protein [Polyangium sp.]
ALQHGFIRRADKILEELLVACEFDDKQRRLIFDEIHEKFVPELKILLADTETAAKFASFKTYLDIGTEERQTAVALRLHAKYQIAQYETDPLFKREPYALKNVYVDTECGKLTWKAIRAGQDKPGHGREMSPDTACDPFSENYGGRHDLLNTVMGYIKDEKFREAIVVQGIAGAGKSSFTLRLCAKLWEEGFHPLRIRFKKFERTIPLFAALNRALELSDDDEPIAPPKDMLRGGDVFDTPWGTSRLSRYVLILDGWDELALTESKSLRDEVNNTLVKVRNELLDPHRTPRVRVIVTGRPSWEKRDKSGSLVNPFLNDETPILTLRPIRPYQLRHFIGRVQKALKEKPVPVAQPDEWTVADPNAFAQICRRYEESFEQSRTQTGTHTSSARFEFMGLPLLAYLTVRVLSEWTMLESESEKRMALFEQLGADPTMLYCRLAGLTCKKAGKATDDPRDTAGEVEKQARETHLQLRKKLQWTAAAMTISGKEYISSGEWVRRIQVLSNDPTIYDVGNNAEHSLVKLMISYYFQGGHRDQSCEFAHKSFREYFFAEAIVETLKGFGAKKPQQSAKRSALQDFAKREDLFEFSQSLAQLLSPQWLTWEVYRHLWALLRWEIGREQAAESTPDADIETDVVKLDQWQQICEGLVHVWSWWVDGA